VCQVIEVVKLHLCVRSLRW